MPEAARGSQTDAIRQDVSSTGLYIIGMYKLVEASLLAAAGFGVLRLLHKDVGRYCNIRYTCYAPILTTATYMRC